MPVGFGRAVERLNSIFLIVHNRLGRPFNVDVERKLYNVDHVSIIDYNIYICIMRPISSVTVFFTQHFFFIFVETRNFARSLTVHVAAGPHVTALIELNRMRPAYEYFFLLIFFGSTRLCALRADARTTLPLATVCLCTLRPAHEN